MKLTISSNYYGSNGTVNKDAGSFVLIEVNTGHPDEKGFVEAMLGVNVKEVVGCYKNNINPAYLVPLPDDAVDCFHLMSEIEDLCTLRHQESMLVVNRERKASLVYFDQAGHVDNLGTFQQAPASEALKLGNWTADGSTFWIVK